MSLAGQVCEDDTVSRNEQGSDEAKKSLQPAMCEPAMEMPQQPGTGEAIAAASHMVMEEGGLGP